MRCCKWCMCVKAALRLQSACARTHARARVGRLLRFVPVPLSARLGSCSRYAVSFACVLGGSVWLRWRLAVSVVGCDGWWCGRASVQLRGSSLFYDVQLPACIWVPASSFQLVQLFQLAGAFRGLGVALGAWRPGSVCVAVGSLRFTVVKWKSGNPFCKTVWQNGFVNSICKSILQIGLCKVILLNEFCKVVLLNEFV